MLRKPPRAPKRLAPSLRLLTKPSRHEPHDSKSNESSALLSDEPKVAPRYMTSGRWQSEFLRCPWIQIGQIDMQAVDGTCTDDKWRQSELFRSQVW